MSDGVKFIFSTLIKIPIYTFIVYFIFNIFTFTTSYFRMLGASHAIEMMVLEENFLSDGSANILVNGGADSFVGALATRITPNIMIIDTNSNANINADTLAFSDSVVRCYSSHTTTTNTDGSVSTSVKAKKNYHSPVRTQFGASRQCGIIWDYKFILPLMPTDYMRTTVDGQTTAVGGLAGFNDGSITTTHLTADEMDALRQTREQNGTVTVKMVYKVPGLKYYADMDNS